MSEEMVPAYNDYLEYLDELRESGEVNMFGARLFLIEKFGLTRGVATEVLHFWMANFGKQEKV